MYIQIVTSVKSWRSINKEVLIKFQEAGENGIVRIFMLYTPHQVLLHCSVKED